MAIIIKLPVRFDVRRPALTMPRKRHQGSVRLRTPQELYDRASVIDETEPREAIPFYRAAMSGAKSETNWKLAGMASCNLGNCYYRIKCFSLAEQCWLQAVELHPECSEAWYNMGVLAQDNQEYDKALALLEHSIELYPTFADAHYNAAQCYECIGKFSKARQAWGSYLKLSQDEHFIGLAKLRLEALLGK